MFVVGVVSCFLTAVSISDVDLVGDGRWEVVSVGCFGRVNTAILGILVEVGIEETGVGMLVF